MERKKIVITGMGAVTPIGVGVERYWDSLVQGVSGIDTIQKLDVEALPIKVAGEVKDFRQKTTCPPSWQTAWRTLCSTPTSPPRRPWPPAAWRQTPTAPASSWSTAPGGPGRH